MQRVAIVNDEESTGSRYDLMAKRLKDYFETLGGSAKIVWRQPDKEEIEQFDMIIFFGTDFDFVMTFLQALHPNKIFIRLLQLGAGHVLCHQISINEFDTRELRKLLSQP